LLSLILTASALWLNNYLVPLLGIDGAALSNLLSYGLYYALALLTVLPLCRIRMVDKRWWMILALLAILFALNWLWQTFVPTTNLWLDSIARSLIFLGFGAFIAYKAELSPEINNQIVNRKSSNRQ
jgi:hypothetical protein